MSVPESSLAQIIDRTCCGCDPFCRLVNVDARTKDISWFNRNENEINSNSTFQRKKMFKALIILAPSIVGKTIDIANRHGSISIWHSLEKWLHCFHPELITRKPLLVPLCFGKRAWHSVRIWDHKVCCLQQLHITNDATIPHCRILEATKQLSLWIYGIWHHHEAVMVP